MLTITQALKYINTKHEGQVDKLGVPYIWHLIRVARKLKNRNEKLLALLHDVIEDTDTSIEEIKALGVCDEIIEALDLLTHKENVPYEEYIRDISTNPLAKTVKLADLADNSNAERLGKLPLELQTKLKNKYDIAFSILNKNDNI